MKGKGNRQFSPFSVSAICFALLQLVSIAGTSSACTEDLNGQGGTLSAMIVDEVSAGRNVACMESTSEHNPRDYAHHDMRFTNHVPIAGEQGSGNIRELVILDASVAGYELLAAAVNSAGFKERHVAILEPHSNTLGQLSKLLKNYQGLESVHIVSHGEQGALRLGQTSINTQTLATHREAIGQLGNSLSDGGDILLYGCSIGAGEPGREPAMVAAGVFARRDALRGSARPHLP